MSSLTDHSNEFAIHSDAFVAAIRQTDRTLWNAFELSHDINHAVGATNLRFPKYRDGELRVSEQEARFIFVSEIAKTQLLYSVEAPTGQVYRFRGKVVERSGATDVAVLTPQFEPLVNVEFKANGYSADRKDRTSFQKDMRKLFSEPVDGCWFHTLERVNRETLGRFWDVFKTDLRNEALKPRCAVRTTGILLHICVLRQGVSIERRLDVVPSEISPNSLTDISSPKYSNSRSSVKVRSPEGWHITER